MINIPALNFDVLLQKAKTLKPDNYTNSYLLFIQYFEQLDVYTKHDIAIVTHTAYGWMPTILKIKEDKFLFDEIVKIINEIKFCQNATPKQLDAIASVINRSIIGTSKMLHFLMPNLFPIWDSRVHKFLCKDNLLPYSLFNNAETYLTYKNYLLELSKHKDFSALKEMVEQKIGYEMSDFRVLEYTMFYDED